RASGASAGYQISQVYGGGLIPILAGLILNAYGIHQAYFYIGLLVMAYAALAILAILSTPETKSVDLEGILHQPLAMLPIATACSPDLLKDTHWISQAFRCCM